jgi:hypothetical protein
VPRVPVGQRGENQDLLRNLLSRSRRHAAGTDEIDVQRQMRPVLLDGAAGDDAHLVEGDGLVDLGPSQFLVALVAVLGAGSAGHGNVS